MISAIRDNNNFFMESQIVTQRKSFIFGFIISLLLHVPQSLATEFYLSVAGGNGKEHCDSLEIRGNTVACTEKKMVIGYDLGLIRGVQIIEDGKTQLISQLTPAAIERINSANQRAQEYEESLERIEQSEVGYLFHRLKSVRSFADFQKVSEKQYQKYGLNGALHLFLPLLGAFLVLVGSLWFIIAAFRVHILWGLGCLFLPLVSLFFLFLHWRAAAKPFVLSTIGGVVALSGIYFFEEKREVPVKGRTVATVPKKTTTKQVKSKYTCQGKTHCSEMRSCEEAKFYLKHCPGTKMDGDHDGIPCEKQWCR